MKRYSDFLICSIYNGLIVITFFFVPAVLTSCIQDFARLEPSRSDPETRARAYMAKVHDLMDSNPVAALELQEKAVEADPKLLLAVRGAGALSLYLANKDKANRKMYLEKATKYANILLREDHDTADGNCMMGYIYHYSNPKLSIEYFKKALNDKINSKDSIYVRNKSSRNQLYVTIGFEYGALQDYQNCLLYFKKFMGTSANDPKCIESVRLISPFIPRLEAYLKYSKKYEPSVASPAHVPESATPGQRPRKNAVSSKTDTTPKSSQEHPSRQPDITRQEYEKIKESLQKAFQERERQIEVLTG